MPLLASGAEAGPALGNPERRHTGYGVPLRIMPLGASITWGLESTDGNGYREAVRQRLVDGGNRVDMVGSRRHGKMRDNDNEGWPGFVVDEVYAKANLSVPRLLPNVVLLNAGTNDCIQNLNVSGAADRLRRLVLGVLSMSPRSTVVLSSLLVNKVAATDRNVLLVNTQYRRLAAELRSAGHPVVFVDMHGSNGPQLADLADDTHPDDKGYRKMAAIWYSGIADASRAGFLRAPESVPGDGSK